MADPPGKDRSHNHLVVEPEDGQVDVASLEASLDVPDLPKTLQAAPAIRRGDRA
jgi:hypothetical protein